MTTRTRIHGTKRQIGNKFPVKESGGSDKILNIHSGKVEEFTDTKIVKTKNNRFRITAEDEDGNEVSQFIKLV